MSFYSHSNVNTENCPGKIQGDPSRGITERACIEVKKVFDACLQQEQLDNVRVQLTNIRPVGVDFVKPLTFVSCRSTTTKGTICDVIIDRIPDRSNFARVRANVNIPIDVIFTDATGRQGSGTAIITVHKDVILFVPNESIVPFTVDTIVSAICATGDFIIDFKFDITVCVTIIVKIVAEVLLLIPEFGFCHIPACEEFAENVCDEFFGLPIFPPQM